MIINDITLCLAASAAYYDKPTFVVAGDVYVVITVINGITVVAFRGTEPSNIKDWIRDFDALPMRNRYLGLCHKGFLTGAEAAIPLLIPLLKGKQFIIVGHSLGGAMAILTGAILTAMKLPPIQITTFGAPNSFIGDGVTTILKIIPGNRYRNGDDPVPVVPMWPFHQDREFTHIGTASIDAISDHFIAAYYSALDHMEITRNVHQAIH
jgi:triacylglycerol lipase